MVFPGWTIARAIPHETLIGLATGQYKLYGGVVRWAAGTAQAGQIVRHLIPAGLNPLSIIPGLDFIPGIVANVQLNQLKSMTQFNTYQLMQISGQIASLSQSTEQILQLATGTAMLSGLGLAVSAIGFAQINHKLNTIDSKLKQVQKDVQAIKYFLESSERAKLFAALNALLKVDKNTAAEHRHTILHHSRNTLGEINMRYRELLSEASTVEMAMAHEEYFSLTALAQVRCTAELGMLDIARKEIEEINVIWQAQAHRIGKEIIVGDHPERFLATDFVALVSVAELAQWLDFVFDAKKGLGWIDELRLKIDERWYSKGWFSESGSGLNQNIGAGLERAFGMVVNSNNCQGLNQNIGVGLEKEQKMLIPALRKLIARSAVFEGYVAQYEFLEEQQIKPSEFEGKLADLPQSESVEGYLILEPANTVQFNQSTALKTAVVLEK